MAGMNDKSRLRLLIEYSLDGKEKLTKDDLVTVLKLYLETDNASDVEILEEACSAMVPGETEIAVEDAISETMNPESDLGKVFSKLSSPKKASPDVNDTPTLPKAVMRGKVSLKDGGLWWEGFWAESAEMFNEGKKNRFKYKFQENYSMDGDKILLKDGSISGSFMIPNEDAKGGLKKIDEPKVSLKVSPPEDGEDKNLINVSGKGRNKFGNFEILGKYMVLSGKLAVEKHYIEKSIWDSDSEESDEEEFIGEHEKSDSDAEVVDEPLGGHEELAHLLEEATMPVEEVKLKYLNEQKNDAQESQTSESTQSKEKPEK